MIFAIGTKFRYPHFNIKERIVCLVCLLFLILLWYRNSYHFFVGENQGNIHKEMVENMKKRKKELGGSQVASKFECEDEKKEKMVVNLSGRGKIIFLRNGEVLAMDCKKRCKVGLTHRHF